VVNNVIPLESLGIGSDDPVSANDILKVETYTVQEVATRLGIGRCMAYDLVRRGVIPAMRLGRRWIVPRARFHAWLNGQCKGA
jgi:excisionase family DNA binding protein